MRALRWAAIAATVVALAEGAFIGRILFDETGARARAIVLPTVDGPSVAVSAPPVTITANDQPTPVTPLSVQVEQQIPGLRVLPAVAADPAPAAADARAIASKGNAAPLPATEPARTGGFRVSAPIELHVLDGERVLGSSFDGPIMTRAGRYELEFVNSVIGYRVHREVEVRAGQITALSIPVPNGRLNINATPWASVWIDGTAYGETPLGNLSIAPGEHEIVFRHPQLGERREKIIVRPDTPGRVAVSLQR